MVFPFKFGVAGSVDTVVKTHTQEGVHMSSRRRVQDIVIRGTADPKGRQMHMSLRTAPFLLSGSLRMRCSGFTQAFRLQVAAVLGYNTCCRWGCMGG